MAENKIDFEVLLNPILKLTDDLSDANIDAAVRKVVKKFESALSKELKAQGQKPKQVKEGVEELFSFAPETVRRDLAYITRAYAVAARDVAKAKKEIAGTPSELEAKQKRIDSALARQAASLRKLTDYLVRFSRVDGQASAGVFTQISKAIGDLGSSAKSARDETSRLRRELKAMDDLPGVEKALADMRKFDKRLSTSDIRGETKAELERRKGLLEYRLNLQNTLLGAGQTGMATKIEATSKALDAVRTKMSELVTIQKALAKQNIGKDFGDDLTVAQRGLASSQQARIKQALDVDNLQLKGVRAELEAQSALLDAKVQASNRRAAERRRQATSEASEQEKRAKDIARLQEVLSETSGKTAGNVRRTSQEYSELVAQLREAYRLADRLRRSSEPGSKERSGYEATKKGIAEQIDLNTALVESQKKIEAAERAADSKRARREEARQATLDKERKLLTDIQADVARVSAENIRSLSPDSIAAKDRDATLERSRKALINLQQHSLELSKEERDLAGKLAKDLEVQLTAERKITADKKVRIEADKKRSELFTAAKAATPSRATSDVLASGDMADLVQHKRQLDANISALEKYRKAKAAAGQDVVYVEREISDLIRLQRQVQKTINDKEKLARAAENDKAIVELRREIEHYRQLGLTISKIASTKDLGRLRELQRLLREQDRAVQDLNRRLIRGGKASGTELEDTAKQLREVSAQQAAVRDQTQRLTGGWAGLNNTVKQFFRYALLYGGLYEVLGVITQIASAVTSLQAEMKNLQAVTASTDRQMVTISNAIRQVALSTKFSAQEIAEAATTLGQAGVGPEEIKSVLQSTADFASAIGGSIATAADLMTTFRDVFSELEDTEIADKLTKVINISKLTGENLQTIVSISGQTARDFGLSADQYLEAAAILRNAGIKASTVTTGLRQLLIDIFAANTSSLKQLEARYQQLGENLTQGQIRARFYSFTQQANPLASALQELQRIGVGGAASGQLGRLYETRAMNVLRALIDNIQELGKAEAELGFGGAAAEAAATQMEALQSQLTNVGSAFTFFATELTSGPVSALTTFVGKITETLDYLTDLDLKLKETGENGIAGNFGLGAAASVVAGSLAGGGIGRKLLVGATAGVAATSAGIAVQGKETPEMVETVGVIAGVLSLLYGAASVVRRWLGTSAEATAELRAAESAAKASATGIARLGYFLKAAAGFIGRLSGWGTALWAAWTAYDYLSDNSDSPEGKLEKARQAEESARKRLNNRIDDISASFKRYADYDPEGEQIGGVAKKLEGTLRTQRAAINDLITKFGSNQTVEDIAAVFDQFTGRQLAREKGTAEYNSLLQKVGEALGVTGAALEDSSRTLVEILNREQDLSNKTKALGRELLDRVKEVEGLSPAELYKVNLTYVGGYWNSLSDETRESIKDAFESGSPEAVAAAVKFTETIFTAADEAKEQTIKDVALGVGEAAEAFGERARRAAAKLIYQLQSQGKLSEAENIFEQLAREQRKFTDSYIAFAALFRDSFAAANGAFPENISSTFVPPSEGGAPYDDILKQYGAAQYGNTIYQAAKSAGVDARLLASLLAQESSFNPDAKSGAGAAGIAQFMKGTGAAYGLSPQDRYDPSLAIPAAARHLRDLIDAFSGDVFKALQAYNAGEGRVREYYATGGTGPRGDLKPETKEYAPKILAKYQPGVDQGAYAKTIARLQQQEIDVRSKAIDDIAVAAESVLSYQLGALPSGEKGEKAYELLTEVVLASADEYSKYLEEIDGVPTVSRELQDSLKLLIGATEAEEVERKRAAEETRKLTDIQREEQAKAAQYRLDQIKEEGGSLKEYSQIRIEIADLQRANLQAELESIEENGAKDQDIKIAEIKKKIAALNLDQVKDITKYAEERRRVDAGALVATRERGAEELSIAAQIATEKGDFEEANRILSETITARLSVLDAKRAEAKEIKDRTERQQKLADLDAEGSGIVDDILDLQKRYRDQLEQRNRDARELGVRTPEERARVVQEQASGITPPVAVQQARIGVSIETLGGDKENLQAQLEKLGELQRTYNLTAAETLKLTEQEKDLTQQILDIDNAIVAKQAELNAQKQGLAQVASVFVTQANNQYEQLADTIGNQLVSGVNGFVSAIGQAAVAGESLGETFKTFFHQFFLNMATAISQALLLKALSSAFPGLGDLLGFKAARGGVVGRASSGVTRAAEGGLIQGSGGIDTTPGAILHPNGSLSPLLVTHEEAILPAGMVRQLGTANVQAAINRYNQSGVAKFEGGGIVYPQQAQRNEPRRDQEAPSVTIVNVPGTSVVADYLKSYDGAQAVLNVLETNPQRARRIIGG